MASIVAKAATIFNEDGFNASLHLLAVAYLQVLATGPRNSARALGLDNNINPRDQLEKICQSGKVAPRVVDRLRRRMAAHANSWESLPLAAAAVLAGNFAGLSTPYLNGFMILYLVTRGLFVRLYVYSETQAGAGARSAVWLISTLSIVWTLIKSGQQLNANSA